MAQVVVRVLASADPSLRNVFDNFRSLSKRASDAVKRENASATKEKTKGYEADLRAFERSEATKTKTALREAAKQTKTIESEHKKRTAIATREEKARVREAEKQHKTFVREVSQGYNRIQTVAGNAFRNFTSIAKTAAGVVTGFAGSMGIETSFGTHVAKAMDVDATTRKVANSIALSQNRTVGAGDNAKVKGLITATGDSAKLDYGNVASGLDEFVKVSTDFKTAAQVFGQLGDLAQATGTDFSKLAGAAGEVNSKLEDGPDKAQKLMDIMTGFAGAGARGAIEISDMAEYMNVLAAGAGKMSGSRVEALLQMNALAQMTRAENKGNPAEATRSAAALMRDVTKGSNQKRLKAAGINVFADKGETELLSPEKIITSILKKTGGSLSKLSKLLPNEMSRAAVEALSDTYKREGEAGIRKRFSGLMDGVTPEAIKSGAENAKGGDLAKTTEINNKLTTMFGDMATRLRPMLERMMPEFEKIANSLIGLAPMFEKALAWATGNPWAAVGVAAGASVAKAAIGEAIKGSLLNLLNGMKPPGGGAPGPGGGGGTLATGLTVAAGLYVGGRALIDSDLNQQNQAGDARRETEFGLGDDRVNAFNKDAKVRKDAREGIKKHIAELDQKIGLGEEYRTGSSLFRSATGVNRFSGWANSLNSEWGQSTDSQAVGKDASEHLAEMWLERKKAGFDLKNSERLDEGGSVQRLVRQGATENGDGKTAAAIQALQGTLTSGITVTVANMPAEGMGPGRVPGGPT